MTFTVPMYILGLGSGIIVCFVALAVLAWWSKKQKG